uniref:Uncharacterized protein n=1 Tax=Anguilla anguilla TaxID=7936 RepID=A0A0E9R8G5_ANGAN
MAYTQRRNTMRKTQQRQGAAQVKGNMGSGRVRVKLKT